MNKKNLRKLTLIIELPVVTNEEVNVETDATETERESRKSNRQRLKPKWMTSGEFQVNQFRLTNLTGKTD